MYLFEVLCALAVAFLCACDGASFKKDVQLTGTTKDLDAVLFKVACGGSCKILGIEFDGYKVKKFGVRTALMKAYNESDAICYVYFEKKKCPAQNITDTEFFIKLSPHPEFTGGKLTVELDHQTPLIEEINADGASVWADNKTGKNYVRIKSGLQEKDFPDLLSQYMVDCDGNCKDLEFTVNSDKGIMLTAADGEPVFVKKGGCYNCICTSNQQLHSKKCTDSNNKDKFSLQSSRVYVTLVPNTKSTDVVAYLKGDNIKSVHKFWITPHRDIYVDKDDKKVLVYPVKGPFATPKKVDLEVKCPEQCKNVKIEVVTDSTVNALYAGKNTKKDDSGRCQDCSCNDVKSCGTRFNPSLGHDRLFRRYTFRITMTLGRSNRNYSAYVKISGDNLEYVMDCLVQTCNPAT